MKDFVSQTSFNQQDGSQSSPYPNINTAINQNQGSFSNLTIILVENSSPYNFTQNGLYPNLNLTLM